MAIKNKYNILIVEDERNVREAMAKFLRTDYNVSIAEDGLRAINMIKKNDYDIVLTDLIMPEADGFKVLEECLKKDPQPSCIVISAYSSAENGFEAKAKGAEDFIVKPINLDYLRDSIKKAIEKRQLKIENLELKKRLLERDVTRKIIGNSAAIHDVLETLRQVAETRATVLILGESGTGKELAARALHEMSKRNGPFIAVHCAALPTNLLESELFGHEKGAFTGATEQRKGRFELADGGTLFLDEIGEIDQTVQVKILRVLETRTFERVGGTEPIYTDVRIVAATNKDLRQLVEDGKFREDLFFRLFVVTVNLPPLRERKEDIPILFRYFVDEIARENNRKIEGISEAAMNVLCSYNWPGNIRELRNCAERMVILSKKTFLDLDTVPTHIRNNLNSTTKRRIFKAEPFLDLNKNEERLIRQVLDETKWNVTKAAKILGISRRTLHRKIHALNLKR
ncbi:MAG TPA: sigma-54 dependent transcriptional regulator [Victivallales bacterium]|nr:sigma-54 dependent transcriptional regulator [Victivallales bacterium]